MSDPKATSVRQRLLNRAQQDGEDFNLVLARYVGLRFLHRLAQSRYSEEFLLKGATLFLVWGGDAHRPTRDMDLLGFMPPDLDGMAQVMREVCAQEVEPDGLLFDPATVATETIREENAYGGIRCTVVARLGSARQKLQIDIGHGDAISPEPESVEIPRLLDDEERREMRAYRVETVIAEKFEAMVSLGLANSRMKDFYDIDFLFRRLSISEMDLAMAIARTFARRKVKLSEGPPNALTSEFWSSELAQSRWLAFASKNKLTVDPLEAVCRRIWLALDGPTRAAQKMK